MKYINIYHTTYVESLNKFSNPLVKEINFGQDPRGLLGAYRILLSSTSHKTSKSSYQHNPGEGCSQIYPAMTPGPTIPTPPPFLYGSVPVSAA